MHYKNGRSAFNGEPVITKDYNGQVVSGVIHNLRPGDTCNCDAALIVPGGVFHMTCQNVGNMYHAADAFAAMENGLLVPQDVKTSLPADQ